MYKIYKQSVCFINLAFLDILLICMCVLFILQKFAYTDVEIRLRNRILQILFTSWVLALLSWDNVIFWAHTQSSGKFYSKLGRYSKLGCDFLDNCSVFYIHSESSENSIQFLRKSNRYVFMVYITTICARYRDWTSSKITK